MDRLIFAPIFKKERDGDFMWCEKLNNGTVKYCERYTDPVTHKKKRVSVNKPKDTPQNRNKAQRELNAKIEAACKYTNASESITLKELQEKYLEAQQRNCKMATITRNEIVTSTVINILGSDAIVDLLTAQYVNQKFLNSDKPIRTLNTYITRFKAMLNWGYQNDYHDNYKLITKLQPFKDTSQDISVTAKYLEPEEIRMLLDYIKSKELWHWWYTTNILILTGMRFGELAALENKDVDLKSLIIHVNKTYDPVNKIVTTPKTDNSVRDIHIQPELLDIIKKCRLWRENMILENHFFTTLFIPNVKTGYYMSHAVYEKFIRETSEKILHHRITPHNLRHTHASLLAASGMTPDEIARRLGHGRSNVTSDIYIHVTKKIIENDNKKLDCIYLTS